MSKKPANNLFDKEKRNLYNLEALWGDGIIKDIKSKK